MSHRARPRAEAIQSLHFADVHGAPAFGPHGYTLFLEILGDRKHEQHEDMVRWIAGVFDPKGFDLNRINRDFKGAKGASALIATTLAGRRNRCLRRARAGR